MKELLERERELAAIEELLERRSGILTIEWCRHRQNFPSRGGVPTGARAWLRRFKRPRVRA